MQVQPKCCTKAPLNSIWNFSRNVLWSTVWLERNKILFLFFEKKSEEVPKHVIILLDIFELWYVMVMLVVLSTFLSILSMILFNYYFYYYFYYSYFLILILENLITINDVESAKAIGIKLASIGIRSILQNVSRKGVCFC